MQANDNVPAESNAAADGPELPTLAVEIGPLEGSVPSLEEALHQAQLKAEEYHDAWLRAKAETENVRRRAQEDISKAAKFAVDRFARELLAVKDSLEAALADRDSQRREPSIRNRADPQATGRRFRQIGTDRSQSARREVRPASAPGDQRRRFRTGAKHRRHGTAEGLPAG
jgi:hypothetical protein